MWASIRNSSRLSSTPWPSTANPSSWYVCPMVGQESSSGSYARICTSTPMLSFYPWFCRKTSLIVEVEAPFSELLRRSLKAFLWILVVDVRQLLPKDAGVVCSLWAMKEIYDGKRACIGQCRGYQPDLRRIKRSREEAFGRLSNSCGLRRNSRMFTWESSAR